MLLSLVLSPSKETSQCSLPKTMEEMLKEISTRLHVKVEGSSNTDNFYISETKPPPDKRSSIWVKTSFPFGIGIIADGMWAMDYGLSGYNSGQIFLFNYKAAQGIIPGGVRLLTEDEITEYGITDTNNEKADRLRWAIFEPGDIEA